MRTLYTSKTGTFNSTNAFLHPQLMNAASGSDIENASATAKIVMPKIETVLAGGTVDVSEAIADTIQVIGQFGNGANSLALIASTTASYTDEEPTYAISGGILTVPAKAEDAPIKYIVKYDREVESGMKLSNLADKFPNAVRLTLYCSYVDPCNDTLRPLYVVLPNFMADPSMTISLDRETQELDYNGNINLDFCGESKVLYYILIPDENIVSEGTSV